MITIFIYGLDEFVVGRLSKELSSNIAKLYEVSEDNVNFVAPSSMVFHNGVEQTSWNILIKVSAPLKVKVLQDQMATFLLNAIGDVAIHKTVEFQYYSQDDRYEKINNDYPRFITEDNLVEAEDHDCEDMEEGDGEDEIYTGDIFENFSDKGNKHN